METLWRAISGMWRMLTTKLGHIRVDFAQPFSLQVQCTIQNNNTPLVTFNLQKLIKSGLWSFPFINVG